ncbi:hypothetical protein SDC9_163288 [bioreactor metagenome]|uniref:Uncharacterized protein n=1 Tax=bioreactor metagenome TaxID=1076179 RepID=A0A645FQR0_9ZZZZ
MSPWCGQRCPDQGTGGVGTQVDVAGDARRQVVLQGFQAEAEQGGQKGGANYQAQLAPVLWQCGRQDEAERDVAQDVEHQILDHEVLWPGCPQIVEQRQATLAPPRKRVQAGVCHQNGIGNGELAGQIVWRQVGGVCRSDRESIRP